MMPLTALANLHRQAGEREQAGLTYGRAIAIGEAAFGSDHPLVGDAVLGLAEVRLARNENHEAAWLLERVLAIRETVAADARELAEVRFALARALWRSKRDRPRALQLAHAACAGLADAPWAAKELAKVEQWIAHVAT